MTQPFQSLDNGSLQQLVEALQRDLQLQTANRMALDLTRGKPAPDQLALSDDMDGILDGEFIASNGADARNYGELRGLPEARALGAEIMDVPAEHIIAGGNSSLFLMHLCAQTALYSGLWGDQRRWRQTDKPKMLAPVPGYDRHFALSEALGIELINIPLHADGPDMSAAIELVRHDASIKGIWCVPKYANPTGCVYSDQVVEAIAGLPAKAAADDFVVFWDNAYAVHDLYFPGKTLASIFKAAARTGTQDHVVQFASTSKITYASAGVAFVAGSETVLATLTKQMSFFMIGPDKVNQLRHVRFLKGRIDAHMQAHAALLRPKFELVERKLTEALGGLGIAAWTTPHGGYFVSLDLLPGQARKVVSMAREAGLTLTAAGATFPYGRDPEDRNVRIAPSFATLEALGAAMDVLVLCIKLSAAQTVAQSRSN